MEGKYTKISVAIAIVALGITIWQVWPRNKNDYSGTWNVTTEIQEATMKTYIGMNVQWVFSLTQSENEVSGTAEKIAVNSQPLNYSSRTSLILQGSIIDSKFIISFIERGKKRETRGIFKGEFSGNQLSGIFSSTASDSKGIITGYKEK